MLPVQRLLQAAEQIGGFLIPTLSPRAQVIRSSMESPASGSFLKSARLQPVFDHGNLQEELRAPRLCVIYQHFLELDLPKIFGKNHDFSSSQNLKF